jgi:hypothetical protein
MGCKNRPQDQLKMRLGPPMILLFQGSWLIKAVRRHVDIKAGPTYLTSIEKVCLKCWQCLVAVPSPASNYGNQLMVR